MRLIVTADIPSDVRQELLVDWEPLGYLEQAHEISLKSPEAPSYIQIMADALQWVTPLKVAATWVLSSFLSQLAKDAAKDIYQHKEQIGRALANAAAAPLRLAAAALKRARDRSPRCSLAIGLPLPNEVTGTVVWLDPDSEEEIALLIARFVMRAETIEQLIQAEIAGGRPPLGHVQVVPTDSGGFLLRWMDRDGGIHEHEVP
jgi:hypothetical protein